MKRFGRIVVIITIVLCMAFAPTAYAADTQSEMRGLWIATVKNIDFPRAVGDVEAQKQEINALFDKAVETGLNTVIVQVCPSADALYPSKINPWSAVLTGTQGQDPGYDPLAYMVEQAHARGLTLHAWINPYRVTKEGTDLSALAQNHPARQHPDWVLEWENALYYKPELAEVKQHVASIVAEVAANYDVDGIHFDDYFYPTGYPLPEGEVQDGAVDQQRRQDVNEMILMARDAAKHAKPEIEFGISPFGIWKNSKTDPVGSETAGNESYYSMSCDTLRWIKEGYVDYIVPQVYWETGHDAADYETLVRWWANAVAGSEVRLYIGQGLYKDAVAGQIGRQLAINDNYGEVGGSVFFSANDLMQNRQGGTSQIKNYYAVKDMGARTFFCALCGEWPIGLTRGK